MAGMLTLFALPAAASAAEAPAGSPAVTGGVAPAATDAAPAPAPALGSPAPGPAIVTSAELAGAGSWTATGSTALGSPVKISGSFRSTLAGKTIRVERRSPAGNWMRATTGRIRSNGNFVAYWRTRSTRYHELRVVLAGAAPASKPEAADAPQASTRVTADQAGTVNVVVLGQAKATWYGPGFYGRTTACGLTLQKDTVGVAHRTLPCGTQVEVRMGGKRAVVPVIDRGPFANGAAFDLTKNVADQIGLDGVGKVQFVERDDLDRLPTPAKAPAIN